MLGLVCARVEELLVFVAVETRLVTRVILICWATLGSEEIVLYLEEI